MWLYSTLSLQFSPTEKMFKENYKQFKTKKVYVAYKPFFFPVKEDFYKNLAFIFFSMTQINYHPVFCVSVALVMEL